MTQNFPCLLQGISNEVEPYFGVNKFQLGRLLRARLQQRLRLQQGRVYAEPNTLWQHCTVDCTLHPLQPPHSSDTLSIALRLGAFQKLCGGSSDVALVAAFAADSRPQVGAQQPKPTPQQAPPDAGDSAATSEDPQAGFTVAVGNGLFWLLPYVMYWASTTTLHSGMFDNGRLDYDHAKCAVFSLSNVPVNAF